MEVSTLCRRPNLRARRSCSSKENLEKCDQRKRKGRSFSPILQDGKAAKRGSSRQTQLDKFTEICLEANETSSLITKGVCRSSPSSGRPDTPTELILKGMTSITFSNYFTPISHDEIPLPKLSWADSKDVWEAMLEKDRKYRRDALYLRRHQTLKPRMRSILLDWLVEVCEVYRLHRETLHLAIDYVDRYLSACKPNIPKQRLQLVGITSLFVAAKMEEIYPPKLSEFAYVTDGACTEDEIVQQEILLLQSLKWDLTPVTPNTWLIAYLQIAKKKKQNSRKGLEFDFPQFNVDDLLKVAQLIDLSLLDEKCLQFSHSILAASSLYHMVPCKVTEITGQTWDDLYPCIQWLAPFAQVVKEQKVPQLKKFDKVSPDDTHNIQVHLNGLALLDEVAKRMNSREPIINTSSLNRNSPVQCQGLLTPPSSTKKEDS